MLEEGRYIGDMIFDELTKIPDFKKEARRLIEGDWRTGSHTFQVYAEPLIDGLPFETMHPSWGEVSLPYVARRIMGHLDIRSDPWLWTYVQLTGALIDPDTVRFALNSIQSSTK